MSAEAGAVGIVLEAQRRAEFPLSAIIELNRRCNLRCKHCYLDLNPAVSLPTEVARRVLDEMAEVGTLFVTFTGGEICLHEGWLELARHARRRGYVVRLKTNGTRMTEREVAEVADLPVLAVDISLYGPDAGVHDEITGRPGSFDRTLTTVRRLRAAGVRVSLRSPVLRTNADRVTGIIPLARELGCEFAIDGRVCPSFDDGSDNSAMIADPADVERVMAELFDELGAAPTPRKGKGAAHTPWPCLTLTSGVCVRADGELWRCPLLPLSYGSVYDGSFREVWTRSEVRGRLRRLARDTPAACTSCELDWVCLRCPAQSWLEHGTLERPATVDCRLAAARAKGTLAVAGPRCDTCVVGPRTPEFKPLTKR